MISYARGLVLKHGERLMVFKNKLDEHRVQFEYTDNGQYVTETIGENYRAIRSGKYTLSQSPLVAGGEPDAETFVTLPAHIEPGKEAGVAYKNKYIRAAIRERIPACSIPKLREMIDRVYGGIQTNENREFLNFLKPSTSAVRDWIQTYKRNGSISIRSQ